MRFAKTIAATYTGVRVCGCWNKNKRTRSRTRPNSVAHYSRAFPEYSVRRRDSQKVPNSNGRAHAQPAGTVWVMQACHPRGAMRPLSCASRWWLPLLLQLQRAPQQRPVIPPSLVALNFTRWHYGFHHRYRYTHLLPRVSPNPDSSWEYAAPGV